MLNLILYGTSFCHLCEQAEAMLGPYVEGGVCAVETVDIATRDEWIESMGMRIPVITCRQTGGTLYWPYSAETLDAWLRKQWQAAQTEGDATYG